MRRPRPHGAVVAWLESVADADLHLPAVTIGEIQAGIEITRERDAAKAGEIEAWLEQVAQTFNILAMDARAFCAWAKLSNSAPPPEYCRLRAMTVCPNPFRSGGRLAAP